MIYILDDLMTIREHREKLALSRILHTKKVFEDAKREAEETSKELVYYARWRVKEENRLFDEIKNKLQKRNDLDCFRESIEELKEKQKKMEAQLDLAEQRVSKAQEDVKKANTRYAMCHRDKKKLEEHKTKWRQRMIMIEQRNEENNLDELAIIRFNTAHF